MQEIAEKLHSEKKASRTLGDFEVQTSTLEKRTGNGLNEHLRIE